MAELVPVFRARVSEKSNTYTPHSGVLNKVEDFNNIVVMSGSAKRRRLETEKSPSVKLTHQKSNFKESFLKLQAPICRTHQNSPEERLMTRSCEILFECIKPYKEIHVARTQVRKSTRTIGSILTTDIVYKRKTRNVQFVRFSEDGPMNTVRPYKQELLISHLTEDSGDSDAVPEDSETQLHWPNSKTEQNQNETGKAITSEDFITDAFSEPESIFLW